MTNKEAIFVLKKEFEYIPSDYDKSALKKALELAIKALEERPQGEFTRKELESWLYQIVFNNIGNYLEVGCEEIIGRLDGFERFVADRRNAEDEKRDEQ